MHNKNRSIMYKYFFTELNQNRMISYKTIRNCIGWFALTLPFIVAIGAFPVLGFRLMDSVSDYYYSNMRDVFIGVLGCVALFLISYKGYFRIDNIVSNLTGVFAAGVALFPADPCTGEFNGAGVFLIPIPVCKYIHLAFAFLFFSALAYNSFFLFTRTEPSKTFTKHKRKRNFIYKLCGIIMVSVILLSIIFYAFLQDTFIARLKPVFFLEAIGLFSFGISWLVKGRFFSRKDKRGHLIDAS